MGSWRRTGAQAALGIAVLVAPISLAHAAPTSKLTYVRASGAEKCPDEAELRKAVAKRVGYDPFFPWAERTVIAQIEPNKAGFTGQVRIIDGQGRLLGERKLAAMSDCGELVQSVALAISVAIDDLDAANPPPATKPKEGESTPDAPLPETAPEPAPPADRADRDRVAATPPSPPLRWHLRTSLGLAGSLGTAPSPAIGATLGIAAKTSWFWLGLEGRADLPASETVQHGGQVATSLLVASLVPCAFIKGSVAPFLCAVGSIGSLAATSEDVSGPADRSARWLALGGRAGVELAITDWLSGYGQLDAGATLARHRLVLNGGEVYQVPAGSVSVGAGVAATFF